MVVLRGLREALDPTLKQVESGEDAPIVTADCCSDTPNWLAEADLEKIHRSVMLERCVELLSGGFETNAESSEPPIYLDATLGMGGHAAAMLAANPTLKLIGVDRDSQALAVASRRLARYRDRIELVKAEFSQFDQVLDQIGVPKVNAMLLDLGVSSLQIDHGERGFSYVSDGPLDMRMNQDQELNAAQIVNEYSVVELGRIFSWYGEEKFANRIAEAIVAARPIATCGQLVQVISGAIPEAAKRKRAGHPAKRVFQALRIEVNAELRQLDEVLPKALSRLAPGGRLAVLSYHSLEDRRVKQLFAKASTDQVPHSMPIVPQEYRAKYRLITRGAEKPSQEEVAANRRATSARLRVIEALEVSR